MIKCKQILLEIIGGIACIMIGVIGERLITLNLSYKHIATNVTQSALAASEKVAVVNLDAGLDKDGKMIYYANQIIEYPNSNYQTTSLEEAKSGVENGRYAAYVIIPSTFSESVNSINHTPKQAVFQYKINTYLDSETREKMIYEILNFEKSINSNISYIYLDAILKEVHNLQDESVTIMGNDKEDLNVMQEISVDNLIEPISFSEMKEKNDPIEDVNLNAEEKKMKGAISAIDKNYKMALSNGKVAFEKLAGNQKKVKDSLSQLKTQVDGYDIFTDDKGSSYVTSGLESLKNEVETSNIEIFNKRTLLNDSIAEEVNMYGESSQNRIDATRKEVQNNIDTTVVSELQATVDGYLKDNNQKIETYVQEQNTSIASQITSYADSLQQYLNQSISSYQTKEVVKNIAITYAEAAFQLASQKQTEYLQNQAKIEAATIYNESVEACNQRLSEMQDAMQELDKAVALLNGTYIEPIESEESSEVDVLDQTEEPVVTVQSLMETQSGNTDQPILSNEDKIEIVTTKFMNLKDVLLSFSELDKQTIPEEMDRPDIHVAIETNDIDTNSLLSYVDIGKALDMAGNAIVQPAVNIEIEALDFKLNKDSITYKVPALNLPRVSDINVVKLSKIEGYYMLPTDRFHKVVQEQLINSIEARNTVLQTAMNKRFNNFTNAQSGYQKSLDEFDPFSYVDGESMNNDIDSILLDMTSIVSKVNTTSSGYRSYVTEVISTANSNIMTLQNDMNLANNRTSKNVLRAINEMKERRQRNSDRNILMLKGFSRKLPFTRVGDLPYREAYRFIINPITYQN